jgi:hypothetical protein
MCRKPVRTKSNICSYALYMHSLPNIVTAIKLKGKSKEEGKNDKKNLKMGG